MKLEIEVKGYAPKQKAMVKKMLEDFIADMPNHISIGAASIREVGGKKSAKQIQPGTAKRKTAKD